MLGTYIAPIEDDASIWAKAREVSGERSDSKWIHPRMTQTNHRTPLDALSALISC
jgi:hypothetical protein